MSIQTTTDTATAPLAVPPSVTPIPDDVLHTAKQLGIADQLPQVIEIARGIYGDKFVLRVVDDPELEDWTHIAVDTKSSGTLEELIEKDETWFKMMVRHNISHWFTLMIDTEQAHDCEEIQT
jgi:hypothetical protein